jgi:hypothetical protein
MGERVVCVRLESWRPHRRDRIAAAVFLPHVRSSHACELLRADKIVEQDCVGPAKSNISVRRPIAFQSSRA